MKKFAALVFALIVMISASAQKLSFKADIDRMTPMGFPSQSGLSGYFLEMNDSTVNIYLPYMGEVTGAAPYGGGDGLNFKEQCTNLKVKDNKKKDGKEISFSVRHENIRYDFNISLYDNNTLYINVQPGNRQSCSYSGNVEQKNQEKEK